MEVQARAHGQLAHLEPLAPVSSRKSAPRSKKRSPATSSACGTPGVLRIGDTLSSGPDVEFEGIPRFSPEHFMRVRLPDSLKRKQLKKGLDQLSEEGAVQVFFDPKTLERDPILGAVGVLQFDVVAHRLKAEYGVTGAVREAPLQPRALGRGGNFDPSRSSKKPTATKCWSTSRGVRWCFSATNGRWARTTEEHPELVFIAAVQPGRTRALASLTSQVLPEVEQSYACEPSQSSGAKEPPFEGGFMSTRRAGPFRSNSFPLRANLAQRGCAKPTRQLAPLKPHYVSVTFGAGGRPATAPTKRCANCAKPPALGGSPPLVHGGEPRASRRDLERYQRARRASHRRAPR